ncbi:MAG TPA: ribonuclease HII [Candidatus Saccharimonadales bacterium]|nr:ribonuclease HII [Candidatus Saccharimonadales bacterium]
MITVGIDEVGRGCWAGPLVAGAVILKTSLPGLRDSKKLSLKIRTQLDFELRSGGNMYGLGWVYPDQIDNLGLTASVRLAMQRALSFLPKTYDQIIIDGNFNYLSHDKRAMAVVKADDIYPSVSAASILAKVARDNYMNEISNVYPNYGFDKHVGYGTSFHIEMLRKYGVTPIHRKSYKPIQALMV